MDTAGAAAAAAAADDQELLWNSRFDTPLDLILNSPRGYGRFEDHQCHQQKSMAGVESI